MSIGNDSFALKKMFDKDMKETAPTIAPTRPAVAPVIEPGAPRPSKPRSPIAPKPGISPKPKARNKDVELFLKQRGLAGEDE